MTHIETERLILRNWKPGDLKPFAKMNQDPLVMEYMPKVQTEVETIAMIERIPFLCWRLLDLKSDKMCFGPRLRPYITCVLNKHPVVPE